MTKIPVSISQLAKYGLDYVSLISSSASRSRPVKTEQMDADLLSIPDLIFKSEVDSITIDLVTALDKQFDPSIPNEEKSDEQRQAEWRVERDRGILNKIQEIDTKIRTDEYTKRVVLQTGFISFEAKRYLESDFNEEYEIYDAPLFQVPVAAINFKYTPEGVTVIIDLPDNYVEILNGPLKNFLPQQYFDKVFKFIADSEAEEKTMLPLADDFIQELWSVIRVQLDGLDAKSISEAPSFATSIVAITNKTNHFLAEDLKAIAALEDEELLETSLGGWVSDEDMAIEQAVSDDGSTEIFFPFDYDKYQLKVLGITANKAVIVEGPPGTGKSQTISNLLVHLAATGKRVLFASQKDQAIRGVKDKLKTLDVPFLYGYIPDKTSKLYTEDDEKDSAANTLLALNREFQKGKVGDLKEPLALLANRSNIFVENLNNERSIYALLEERRSLSYLDSFHPYEIDSGWYSQCGLLEDTISGLEASVNKYEKTHEKFLRAANKKFENLELDYQATIDSIENIYSYFKENMPERAGWIGGKVNEMKLRNALKEHGRTLLQEIYVEVEKILFSDNTKSARLQLLDSLSDYFVYGSELQAISESRSSLNELLSSKEISPTTYTALKKVISENSKEKVFNDLTRYNEITEQIEEMSLYSANELNREIKDIRKFYRTNITNYVRNRILTRIGEANNSKDVRATLAQVARSLTKSKKANKTFDRLKHNEDNFSAMSKVLPIWMMSLDDVSRIVPLEKNAFDYVIIDEASQCNFAYAFPAMFRAEHTIFFGDTLQMRDDNIMFKSNDQLNAIAKKHKIPEVYQIKAEEDTVKSVMDIAHLNGFMTTTLKYHYRSPKELIGFSNESFYEPIGRKLEAVNDNIVPYKDTGRVLLTHIVKPDDGEETSDKTNFAEIRKIQELVDEIKNDPVLKDKSIAILTFFNEQAELIRNAIKDDDIKVSIIDGIQGDERDIVIYSFVIKDPSDKKRYIALTGEGGEIRKDIAAGRVNVAFSRARLQVHTVTSLAPELWPEGIWIKRYLEYVETSGIVNRRHSKSEQQFDSNFEEKIFSYLAKELDASEYTLETQVESLGFKIDLVVCRNGKKLAIEMDGPSHFEGGDGQVYVKDDWDRQGALETAGWNFYRISYFDWTKDQEVEQKALSEYIQQYFADKSTSSKTTVLKELEKETVAPEEAPKDMYVTDFSDEHVDNVSPVQAAHVTSNVKRTDTAKTTPAKPTFSIGDREVNQEDFERYLSSRQQSYIEIRYQSMRAGSAKYWRTIRLDGYDGTYMYSKQDNAPYPIKYRRDRVIEFR
ncbi:MAG TPA: AAA domain-containing protein [Candidatus Saccharimonadales bacterium]|nr:AAA domain-containing protein [Candidatus Saccharimonadales bacterium]